MLNRNNNQTNKGKSNNNNYSRDKYYNSNHNIKNMNNVDDGIRLRRERIAFVLKIIAVILFLGISVFVLKKLGFFALLSQLFAGLFANSNKAAKSEESAKVNLPDKITFKDFDKFEDNEEDEKKTIRFPSHMAPRQRTELIPENLSPEVMKKLRVLAEEKYIYDMEERILNEQVSPEEEEKIYQFKALWAENQIRDIAKENPDAACRIYLKGKLTVDATVEKQARAEYGREQGDEFAERMNDFAEGSMYEDPLYHDACTPTKRDVMAQGLYEYALEQDMIDKNEINTDADKYTKLEEIITTREGERRFEQLDQYNVEVKLKYQKEKDEWVNKFNGGQDIEFLTIEDAWAERDRLNAQAIQLRHDGLISVDEYMDRRRTIDKTYDETINKIVQVQGQKVQRRYMETKENFKNFQEDLAESEEFVDLDEEQNTAADEIKPVAPQSVPPVPVKDDVKQKEVKEILLDRIVQIGGRTKNMESPIKEATKAIAEGEDSKSAESYEGVSLHDVLQKNKGKFVDGVHDPILRNHLYNRPAQGIIAKKFAEQQAMEAQEQARESQEMCPAPEGFVPKPEMSFWHKLADRTARNRDYDIDDIAESGAKYEKGSADSLAEQFSRFVEHGLAKKIKNLNESFKAHRESILRPIRDIKEQLTLFQNKLRHDKYVAKKQLATIAEKVRNPDKIRDDKARQVSHLAEQLKKPKLKDILTHNKRMEERKNAKEVLVESSTKDTNRNKKQSKNKVPKSKK